MNNQDKQQWKRLRLQTQLILLEIGGIINDVTFSGPPWRGLRRLIHQEKYAEQSRIQQTLYRLEHQGLIKRQGRSIRDGFELTNSGLRQIKRIQSDQLVSPKHEPWDKKWHLIFFDIPENNRAGRDVLRRRLYQLGCEQIQKSVFLYPYNIRQLIEQIREAYDLQTDLVYAVAENLDGQEHYREYFIKKGILPIKSG